MLLVSQIFIYPIKSLKGIEVTDARLSDRGLQYDRRWMLIDENNKFLSQRECSQMALMNTSIEADNLVVFQNENSENKCCFPLEPPPSSNTFAVTIWDDVCEAQAFSSDADQFFSDALKIKCRLVFMPASSHRKVETEFAVKDAITNFSDGYPILMIGQSSLDDLNSRLKDALPMDRFRPNIVFTGAAPFEEDMMEEFTINGTAFYAVKPCVRCVITTINQQTGLAGKEPMKTLSTFRRMVNEVLFGQNILYAGEGDLKIGDQIHIVKTRPAINFT